MELKGRSMEAGWHPKQPNGANKLSKGIKVTPKGHPKWAKQSPKRTRTTQMEPKWSQSEPTEAIKWQPAVQVLVCYGFGIYFRSYLGAFWEQIPSTIASKIDAKIIAENVMDINAKMNEKYAKIDGESMNNHWTTIETLMILGDLQNLDFCDTHVVKARFCMYSDGDKSMRHLQNPVENPCSEKLCRNYMKIMNIMWKRLLKSY